jgi:hypothetical protein
MVVERRMVFAFQNSALAVMSSTGSITTPIDNTYHSAYPCLSPPPAKISIRQLLDLSSPPSSRKTPDEPSTWFCDEAPHIDNFPELVLPSSALSSSKGAQADASTHRTGYYHSWFKQSDINHANLTVWVSNSVMKKSTVIAHRQSNALLGILGMLPCIPAPLLKSVVPPRSRDLASSDINENIKPTEGSPEDDNTLHAQASQLTRLLLADSGVDKDCSNKENGEMAGLAAATAALFTPTHQHMSVPHPYTTSKSPIFMLFIQRCRRRQ